MNILWPVAVVALFAGFSRVAWQYETSFEPRRPAQQAAVQGAIFDAYRNAVVNYVIANPSFLGTVPSAALTLAGTVTALPGLGNQIVATTAGTGRIIYVYAALPTSAAGGASAAAGGDQSIGVVSGAQWSTPSGGVVGKLPVLIPSGDIVSVTQIGA